MLNENIYWRCLCYIIVIIIIFLYDLCLELDGRKVQCNKMTVIAYIPLFLRVIIIIRLTLFKKMTNIVYMNG